MDWILGLATLLGGASAAWYFRDRLRGGRPIVREKLVDNRYPVDSGLEASLAEQGYEVSWVSRLELARKTDLEGWEQVVLPSEGGFVRFTTGLHVLLKRKRQAPPGVKAAS